MSAFFDKLKEVAARSPQVQQKTPGTVRTVRQIEQEMESRTEMCMSEKKGGSIGNALRSREYWRGECETYQREAFADELRAAQENENRVTNAVNNATIAQANAQAGLFSGSANNSQTIYLILALTVAAAVIILVV